MSNVWFVYREHKHSGRIVGPLFWGLAPAFRLWCKVTRQAKQGVIRLMYGDCVLPAKTYRVARKGSR